MASLYGLLGRLRCLAVPLLALGVVAAVAAAGVAESRAERVTTCGPRIAVQDPDVRASLARFDQHQSAGARKVCTIYRDRH